MADSGSPPLSGPGGLHVYSMNGGSHKMAELVLGDSSSSHSTNLNCQDVANLDHYTDGGGAVVFPTETSIHQTSHSPSYLSIEPISYPETGMYEDLKRPSQSMQTMPYFSNMESGGSTDGPIFEPFKNDASHSGLSGYIDMLGNSEPLMTIKREKIDYSEQMGLVNSSGSSDIPYPPNTCVPDWNFYNPVTGNGHFQHQGNASATFGYSGQHHQFPTNNMMYSNTQPLEPQFQSNDDIHFHSKKITQSILSNEWGADTLYKSHLYSNLAMDSTNRKRRAETEKTKNAKARRKKSSSDLGGHSKTVASILLSENATSTSKQSHTSGSTDDILDSTARNTLVSTLMDNIRSTVQFESFCLSFPRSDVKEAGFRHKIRATTNLIENIHNLEVRSDPFPTNFIMGASKVITNFRNALKNTTTNGAADSNSDWSDGMNPSMEQVEEHLPHSMVWVVKLGDRTLSANWEGQFVVGINPVQKILSISVFQFQPNFSAEGIKCLQQTKLSKALADDIRQNMEQFEVSRQLRCDVNLNKVNQLYLYKANGETDEGCLILELSEGPVFYQRWLHTSAEDKNKWRQRQNFFTKADSYENRVLYIGGLVTELNELVALMLGSDHEFESLYEKGIRVPFVQSGKDGIHTNHGKNSGDTKADGNLNEVKFAKNKRLFRKLGSNANKLRKEIVEVLVHHNILEQDSVEKVLANVSLKGDKDSNSEVCLGISLDDSCCCFQDYINYSCDSAIELNTILEKELQPRAFGFYENDFDLTKVPDENIDKLKIGQLISCKCSQVVYYSFCNREVGQLGYDTHCPKCHRCRTIRYWHCETCDQCTESRSVCIHCGHLRNDQTQRVVKPLSVFRSQVSSAQVVSLEDIKQEWITSLDQPDDDILTLVKMEIDTNCADVLEYNSHNAMVDQLGLLNPVGFLLGQPNVGAARKHRRHKGGQFNDIVPQPKKPGQSSGSGCTVQ